MKKYLFIFIGFCCLVVSVAYAATVFDAQVATPGDNGSGGGGVVTATMTVGSGANRALVAELSFATSPQPSGLTVTWDYGGSNQAMTEIASSTNASDDTTVTLWGLVNPVSGSKTLSAAWTGTTEAILGAFSVTGANQTGGTATFANATSSSNTGSTPSPSVTVTSASGDLAVSAVNGQLFVPTPSNQTTLYAYSGVGSVNLGSSYGAGAATVTFNYATGDGYGYETVGMDIVAAASSTGVGISATSTHTVTVLPAASLTVSGIAINNGSVITLTPATTQNVPVSFQVTDTSGCSAVFSGGSVTTTLYRATAPTTTICTANNQNCYITTSVVSNCSSGNSANATATLPLYYFADSTGNASSSYPSSHWYATVQAHDTGSLSGIATSTAGVDVGVLSAINVVSQGTSYAYYRAITVTSTASVASGTLANFPMLVSSTLSSWASASHGGHIQNLCTAPNGGTEPCDLVFATSTANCATAPLNFETESYSSSTGSLVDWVNVPTMQAGAVIYACYDSASTTADQSHPSATWNANYGAVYHLGNGNGLSLNDSTANGGTLTNNNSVTTAAGEIDGAGGFSGSNDLNTPSNSATDIGNDTTLEAWVYDTSPQNNFNDIISEFNFSEDGYFLFTDSGVLNMYDGAFNSFGVALSPDTWTDVVVTLNGTTAQLYINGNLASTITLSNGFINGSTAPFDIGSWGGSQGEFWQGAIDEVRMSSMVRSPSWILTEYNNQANPGAFYAVGGETGLGAAANTINYGTVAQGENTGSTDQLVTVQNAGNSVTTLQLSGTALAFGADTIATSSQHYATTSFTYGGSELALSDTATTIPGFALAIPTSTTAVSSTIYWGIQIPSGASNGSYTGTNIFTAAFGGGGGAGFTPVFVSETSKNSTLANALSTNPSGQTECPNFSYCLPYTDLALSGNLGVVPFEYATSSVVSATASDDKSDSYTCLTGSEDSGTTDWNGLCYAPNLTPGAHSITLGFGTGGGVTNVTAKAAMFYNVATSNPLDASGHAAGASSSTVNAVSVTTTLANDLVYVYVCRAGTPSVGSFTAGPGFTLLTTDINDGCASEYEVDSGTGSITPVMTMASASTYTEFVAAFKAAAAGTAPSGWYADKIESWSSVPDSSGNHSFQFPSSGNLLFDSNSCGGSYVPGSITDSVNTWISAGTANNGAGFPLDEFYVPDASANSTGALAVNVSGTGDCTFTFYDFVGAPASPVVARAVYGSASGTSPVPWVSNALADGSTGSFLPDPTNGMVMAVGGQIFNTTIGFASPTSTAVCPFDGASYGGMSLNGPEPIDENNTWGHCYFSAGNQPVFSFAQSSSTLDTNGWEGDLVGFWGSSGMGIVHWAEGQATSTATLTVNVSSTAAGNLLAVAVGDYATGRTVSEVCLDGTACATGNAFTEATGSVTTGSVTHANTDIWYLLGAPANATTVTITFSGSATNVEAMYEEVQKGGGGSWVADGANRIISGAGDGSGVDSGPPVTTTGSADFCLANIGVVDEIDSAGFPAAGNEFTYGGVWFSNTADSAVSLLTTTAGVHTPAWTDIATGDGFSSSAACFK